MHFARGGKGTAGKSTGSVEPACRNLGRSAEVLYAGGAPGLVAGVLQVNVRVPQAVTPGSAEPVVLVIGNAASQSGLTMAVR